MDSQNLITALLDAISNFPVTYGYVVEIYIYSCTRWLWLLYVGWIHRSCAVPGATGGWRDSTSSLSRTVHWQTCPSGNTPPSRETHHRVPDM